MPSSTGIREHPLIEQDMPPYLPGFSPTLIAVAEEWNAKLQAEVQEKGKLKKEKPGGWSNNIHLRHILAVKPGCFARPEIGTFIGYPANHCLVFDGKIWHPWADMEPSADYMRIWCRTANEWISWCRNRYKNDKLGLLRLKYLN
jgi:hypothetical protein